MENNLLDNFIAGCNSIEGNIIKQGKFITCDISKDIAILFQKSDNYAKIIDKTSRDEAVLKNVTQIIPPQQDTIVPDMDIGTNIVGGRSMEIYNNKGDSMKISNRGSQLNSESGLARVFINHDKNWWK